MNTGGMTAFAPNATLASAGITIPASLDISQWNPSMFQMQITYDANGNPMYSNPGMAAMMRQMSQDVGNYAAATGASIGGAQGNYLTQLAAANTGWTESQARWAETPHNAPTQEDIDEQRRISAQASKDFRESLTAGKDNLENIKNYNNIKYNYISVNRLYHNDLSVSRLIKQPGNIRNIPNDNDKADRTGHRLISKEYRQRLRLRQ